MNEEVEYLKKRLEDEMAQHEQRQNAIAGIDERITMGEEQIKKCVDTQKEIGQFVSIIGKDIQKLADLEKQSNSLLQRMDINTEKHGELSESIQTLKGVMEENKKQNSTARLETNTKELNLLKNDLSEVEGEIQRDTKLHREQQQQIEQIKQRYLPHGVSSLEGMKNLRKSEMSKSSDIGDNYLKPIMEHVHSLEKKKESLEKQQQESEKGMREINQQIIDKKTVQEAPSSPRPRGPR